MWIKTGWLLLVLLTQYAADAAEGKCERLKTTLTYRQEKAPRDLSGVLQVVVERINRVLDGVVDVEVEWGGGDLHGKVGEHIVSTKVTRLSSAVQQDSLKEEDVSTDSEGRQVVVQCFHIPFTILDTNECSLPVGHPMRHQCHEPSVCVNTIGSYECLCPLLEGDLLSTTDDADDAFWELITAQKRTPWELSFNTTSETSCPSKASTHGCCPEFGHSSEGTWCRSAFRCPIDPCSGDAKHNDCANNARCHRKEMPLDRPNYKCQCPHGLMGNGHSCRPGIDAKPQPRVMFDGVTPTEETVRNNFYCGCSKPVVDACSGFPPCKGKHEICTVTKSNTPICACKPGFVNIDGYGCVDETPPILRLRNDPDGKFITRLKQGDVYKEHAVDIIDDNAEEYMRSLKITYSQPLPPGCLTKIGEFHVNYTVATPWTSPPYVRVTRQVIIEDIDECTLDVSKYETACPELVPRCDFDAGAKCVNTVGSYTCRCPEFTTGDGFRPISTDQTDLPKGYKGGSGCRDTSKPVIELFGPNPKMFKACRFSGLTGIMGKPKRAEDGDDLLLEQRKRYESDLKELIQFSSGAELCATHLAPNPKPDDCVRATDHTYKGEVDLSSRVKIGELTEKSQLHWSVPYNVMDEAGNEAVTVWRDVVVEEVNLCDLEYGIRMEATNERGDEIKEAVRKAVEEERRKNEKAQKASALRDGGARASPSKTKECPPCPKCVCPDAKGFDKSMCKDFCAKEAGTCPSRDEILGLPYFTPFMEWLEGVFPPPVIYVTYWCTAVAVALFLLRFIVTFLFGRRDGYDYSRADMERQLAFQNAVTYHQSPGAGSARAHITTPGSAPPTAFTHRGADAGNGLFSPQENRLFGQDRIGMSPFLSPPVSDRDYMGRATTPGSATRQQQQYVDGIYEKVITPSRSGQ